MKCMNYYLLLTLSLNAFAEIQKPCTSRAGQPLPIEGSGLCRGNLKLEIPLNTAGLSLVYNSQSNLNLGYGVGWSIGSDLIFEKVSAQQAALYLGDGTRIDFAFDGAKWAAVNPALYKEKLVEINSTTIRQTMLDGSYFQFAKIGTSNRYGLSIKWSRKGTQGSYGRTASGQLLRATNFFYQNVYLSYTSGKLSTVSDYKGTLYKVSYDSNGKLAKVTYPDASVVEVTYNPGTNLIASHKDQKNRLTSFQYYQSGSDSALKAVTDFEGLVTNYSYSVNSVEVKGFVSNLKEVFSEVNGLRQIDSVSNGANYSEQYDQKMRLVKSTDSFNLSTNYSYNGDSQLVQKIERPDGILQEYVYDANDKVIQESVSGNGQSLVKKYTRDAYGQVTKKEENGLVELFTYDGRGNILKHVDAANKVAFSSTYYNNSLPGTVTDIEGNKTTYAWDSWGNAKQVIAPTGETLNATYDAIGSQLSASKVQASSTSSVSKTYDGLGRLLSRIAEVVSGSSTHKSLSNHSYSTDADKHSSDAQLNGSSYKKHERNYNGKGKPVLFQESLSPEAVSTSVSSSVSSTSTSSTSQPATSSTPTAPALPILVYEDDI